MHEHGTQDKEACVINSNQAASAGQTVDCDDTAACVGCVCKASADKKGDGIYSDAQGVWPGHQIVVHVKDSSQRIRDWLVWLSFVTWQGQGHVQWMHCNEELGFPQFRSPNNFFHTALSCSVERKLCFSIFETLGVDSGQCKQSSSHQ